MSTESSIQMKIKNGSYWELLYPNTKAELVKDLNNFSSININNYDIVAGNCNDTLNIIAGNNINIVPNNINKSITISATTSINGLTVTESEKRYWNSKEDSETATLKLQESKNYAKEYTDSKINSIQVPNKISLLENDLNYATEIYVKTKIAEAQFAVGEGNIDLSGYATKDQLFFKADTNHTHSSLHAHANKTVLDNITENDLQRWDNKSTFSGNYKDLIGKPSIPTSTSQLNKDDVYDKTLTNLFLDGKVDKVNDKVLSTNDFTNAYKVKLEGLFNYVHPNTNSIRHVTDNQIEYWNSKSNSNHTHTQIGIMDELNTLSKINLVAAINELLLKIDSISSRVEDIENEIMANIIRTSNADGIITNTGDKILYSINE